MTKTAYRMALATGRDWPDLDADERLVLQPMRELGIEAVPAVWDDPGVEWRDFDGVLVRSCWDYSWRLTEFLDWLDRVEGTGTVLRNPADVIRRNVDKRYLRDLEAAGHGIVPTVWVDGDNGSANGTVPDLGQLLESRGWDSAVVKPAVSAGARNTWRVTRDTAAGRQADFETLVTGGAAHGKREAAAAPPSPVMVQPFLEEVQQEGEWSLVFFGGEFSHAVLKRPAGGDYRVQEDFGGTVTALGPGDLPESLLEKSRAVLESLGAGGNRCVYARVDGVRSAKEKGNFQIMEVELTEPSLYLGTEPGAPMRLARAVAAALAVR